MCATMHWPSSNTFHVLISVAHQHGPTVISLLVLTSLASSLQQAQQLGLSAAAAPGHLPLSIQQLLAQSTNSSSNSSRLLLLLLLPQQIDTLESQESAARMLQLATACVPAAPADTTAAAVAAAAAVKPVSSTIQGRYSSTAPPRNPAVDRLNKQVCGCCFAALLAVLCRSQGMRSGCICLSFIAAIRPTSLPVLLTEKAV